MEFSVTQRFDAPLDAVLAVYTSTDMWTSLSGFTKVSAPELVGREEDNGSVTIQLRYRFIAHLPSVATAVVDPRKLSWIEETTTDLAGHGATVRFRPEHYADKIRASATVTYAQQGAATERRTTGSFDIRVPLVGGKAERVIVPGLEDHLREEQHAVAAYLAGRP